MADEVTEAPEPTEVEDKPVTDAPSLEETSASEPSETTSQEDFTKFRLEDVPDEHREYVKQAYDQMRGDYTRKTQELAQQRREAESAMALISDLQSEDPDTRSHAIKWIAENFGENAVLEALGVEVEDGAEDDEAEDKQPEFRDPRVDQLLAERERQEQEAALADLEKNIDTRIKDLASQAGYELDEDEEDLIWDKVLALPPLEDGSPNIDEAFKKVTGLRQKFAPPKPKPKAPSPPAEGTSGTPASVPLSDPKARREAALAAANRAFESANS